MLRNNSVDSFVQDVPVDAAASSLLSLTGKQNKLIYSPY